MGVHGAIEFGNRLVGVALELVGLVLLVAVLLIRSQVPRAWLWLAAVQALVVPVQAVVGGLLVLSDRNPYLRALHFLASFPILLAAAALLRRTLDGTGPRVPLVRRELRLLTAGLLSAASVVLIAGAL
jgi:cytochrome c oxidase assembly protein subunit 15